MLSRLKNEWKTFLENELKAYLGTDEITPLSVGVPPKSDMGDIAFPMFPYAKAARKGPQQIAQDLKDRIGENHPEGTILIQSHD